MEHKRALKVGRSRARQAARALRRCTGVEACDVCAVKPGSRVARTKTRDWEPVGEESWKEIARDNGRRGGGKYHLVIVDQDGTPKACSRERFPLRKALELADRVPLPVAEPGRGRLWRLLDEKVSRADARHHALHMDA